MPQARVLLWAVVVIGGCCVLLLSSSRSQLLGRIWIAPVTQVPTRTHSGETYHTPRSSTSRNTSQQTLNTTEPPHRSTVLFGCLEGVVTVQAQGRFGNVFMEYATVLGVARVYNLTLVLPEGIARPMKEAFEGVEGLTLGEFLQERNGSDGAPCAPRLPEKVVFKEPLRWRTEEREPVLHGDGPIVIRKWVVHEKYVVPIAWYIRRNLHFRQNLQEYAQNVLHIVGEEVAAATGCQPEEVVYVGVHSRRTDYLQHIQKNHGVKRLADETYFVRAVGWLRSTLRQQATTLHGPNATAPPLAVILVSDDMDWVRSSLLPAFTGSEEDRKTSRTRAFAAGSGREEDALRDLALLAACNHSVLTYGTYGMTAALLAGGLTVVFDVDRPEYHDLRWARASFNWVAIQ